MASKLDRIVIECTSAKPLAGFWAAATGYRMARVLTPGAARLSDPDSNGPDLYFAEVHEPKRAPNRVLLELGAVDLEAEVEVLTGLGATGAQVHEADGERWATLADPEGNELIVRQR